MRMSVSVKTDIEAGYCPRERRGDVLTMRL